MNREKIQLDINTTLLIIILCLFGYIVLIHNEKTSFVRSDTIEQRQSHILYEKDSVNYSEDNNEKFESMDWSLDVEGPYLSIEVVGDKVKIEDKSKSQEITDHRYRHSNVRPAMARTQPQIDGEITNEQQIVHFGSSTSKFDRFILKYYSPILIISSMTLSFLLYLLL
ncbi:hypothetical protein [Enterococcus mundtii]|uniref:hypothetical protein n=1 Tax=Enterococcus mundtii TaxID=53346 RepID=UPI001CCD345F|nr:hypothetical protein [Enterococcus mundtii]MEC3942478.1 hypothetical protein [Enterococcus mundtii]UBM07175.1 hypothetical protein K9N66_15185 [Enterococcus mundtii]